MSDMSDWSTLKDDLWFDPLAVQPERAAVTPASIRFFGKDTNTSHDRRVAIMNEITVAAAAMRAASDALIELSKRLDLGMFDAPSASASTVISATQLQMLASEVSTKHGVAAVKTIISDEAGGKKIAAMSEAERDLVRIAFELLLTGGAT